MPVEIERKFLVPSPAWREAARESVRIRQAYLATTDRASVRVRIKGDTKATLTIKLPDTGVSRLEFEYEIPLDDAEVLMRVRQGAMIEKVRHHVPFADNLWEVDVFQGENEGLVMAEIELERENQPFERPVWLGEEVTADHRYHNSTLAERPYRSWRIDPNGLELAPAE